MRKSYWIIGAIVVAALAIALTAGPVFAHGGNTTTDDGEPYTPGEYCGGTGMMGGGHMGIFGGYMLNEIAEALNLEPDELEARLEDGETIAEIAGVEGIGIDTVTDTLLAYHAERIQKMVDEGYLNEDDALEMTEHMQGHIEELINAQLTGGYGNWGHDKMMGELGHMSGGSMGGFWHGGMMSGFGSSEAFGHMGRNGGMGGFGRGGMMGSW